MTTTTAAKHKPRPRLTDEEREQRLIDAHARISQGVAAIQTSDDWSRWLKFGARFHKYSFNNVMLILVQCPEATRVASAGRWRELNRFPRKGSKALWIYAPVIVKYTAAEIAKDPTKAGQSHLIGFKVVPVFDVSQTDGEPLPVNPLGERPELLEGEAPDVSDQVSVLLGMIGYDLRAGEPTTDGALGETDTVARMITLRPGMSDAQTFKTLIHEIGHALLHDPRVAPEGLTRPIAEVEAESVAFIVCEHFGVRSDDYSFGYITGWAGRDADALMKTGARVMQAAKKIIAALDIEEN